MTTQTGFTPLGIFAAASAQLEEMAKKNAAIQEEAIRYWNQLWTTNPATTANANAVENVYRNTLATLNGLSENWTNSTSLAWRSLTMPWSTSPTEAYNRANELAELWLSTWRQNAHRTVQANGQLLDFWTAFQASNKPSGPATKSAK